MTTTRPKPSKSTMDVGPDRISAALAVLSADSLKRLLLGEPAERFAAAAAAELSSPKKLAECEAARKLREKLSKVRSAEGRSK